MPRDDLADSLLVDRQPSGFSQGLVVLMAGCMHFLQRVRNAASSRES